MFVSRKHKRIETDILKFVSMKHNGAETNILETTLEILVFFRLDLAFIDLLLQRDQHTFG